MSESPKEESLASAAARQDGSDAPRKRGGRLRRVLLATFAVLLVAVIASGVYFFSRYTVSEETVVDVYEYPSFKYAEDPGARSPFYSEYDGRRLKLVQRDDTHFDFVFEPLEDHVAKVVFKDVDVSLMTVNIPENTKDDDGLRRIALTDREWNRQQVQFHLDSDKVELTGGDGFEKEHLQVASLARNCLNAGLWEVLLFTETETGKEMYYQGWFNFPIGQYKRLWEANNGLSYWSDRNFYRMEHWLNPEGNVIPVDRLREVLSEAEVEAGFDPEEPIRFGGEQVRKRRTTQAPGVRTWGDVIEKRDSIKFAMFHPPGIYKVSIPWSNRYELLAKFQGATHRRVKSTLNDEELDELELRFETVDGEETRLFIGGVDLSKVPAVSADEYSKGLYLPMGIGTPPFYQDYAVLEKNSPKENPYYSFFLNEDNAWLDHHSMSIDGPAIHRDKENPDLLHLYLMSYERHMLVTHITLLVPAN